MISFWISVAIFQGKITQLASLSKNTWLGERIGICVPGTQWLIFDGALSAIQANFAPVILDAFRRTDALAAAPNPIGIVFWDKHHFRNSDIYATQFLAKLSCVSFFTRPKFDSIEIYFFTEESTLIED